jgi:hypothetical protein
MALIVLPGSLTTALDVDRSALSDALRDLHDKNGSRYTVADHDGSFQCPRCSMPGCAPESR